MHGGSDKQGVGQAVDGPPHQHTAYGSIDGRGRRGGGKSTGIAQTAQPSAPSGTAAASVAAPTRRRRRAVTAKSPPRRLRRPQRYGRGHRASVAASSTGSKRVGRFPPPSSAHSPSCPAPRRPPRRQPNWPPCPDGACRRQHADARGGNRHRADNGTSDPATLSWSDVERVSTTCCTGGTLDTSLVWAHDRRRAVSLGQRSDARA